MQSRYCLIAGAHARTTPYLRRMLARLAVSGSSPVQWLACGHFLDLQGLIYAVVLRTGGDYHSVLKHKISIRRAETPYQVLAALGKCDAGGGPLVISDLLRHFYGDKIKPQVATELFGESLGALREVSRAGRVVVSAGDAPEVHGMYLALRRAAGRVIEV